MKKTIVASLFIVILSCLGCTEKLPSNTPINSDVKAAFSFKPGTYWIYKDSASGRTDSFYVLSNQFSPNSGDSTNSTEDVQRIYINEKNPDTLFTKDSTFWTWLIIDNYVFLTSNTTTFNIFQIPTFSYLPFFSYPFTPGTMSANDKRPSSDLNNLQSIIPNYTLNGQSYANVAMVSHIQTTSGLDTYNDLFYINDSVGIVKMSLNHPIDSIQTKVWELQRCNIVK